MKRHVVVLIGLAACGGPQRPSPPATSCDEVAAHLLELAEHDNHDVAAAGLATGVRSESSRQCRETPWTEARRACLLHAATQDQTLACPER